MERKPENTLMERTQLQSCKISWHSTGDRLYEGMSVHRWVREKYKPAPGYHFVDWDNRVFHIPIGQEDPRAT